MTLKSPCIGPAPDAPGSSRDFHQQLIALHEVGLRLAGTESCDDLCRQAVELGRSHLGFDRPGIILYDAESRHAVGAFSTGEDGLLRDDRHIRWPVHDRTMIMHAVRTGARVEIEEDVPLVNQQGAPVGQGWKATAVLWDGERALGWLVLDNLLRQEPVSERLLDLLALYATTVGTLLTRKRAEEALRETLEDLEVRVQARTAELEAAYREWEAFAHAVAHDLRSPLTLLTTMTTLLGSDPGVSLGENGDGWLQQMRRGLRRQQQIIDGLMQLTSATRQTLAYAPVDLSALAAEIAEALRLEAPGRTVHFSIAPGLKVVADARLLRVALENLLGNAWKYTAHTPAAEIAFGVVQREGEQVFYVRDNGAGFDMQRAQYLFQAFTRLHGDEDFGGFGIGLATVQRIVQRHCGRIWAEGAPGKGAVFYFTLPLASGGG